MYSSSFFRTYYLDMFFLFWILMCFACTCTCAHLTHISRSFISSLAAATLRFLDLVQPDYASRLLKVSVGIFPSDEIMWNWPRRAPCLSSLLCQYRICCGLIFLPQHRKLICHQFEGCKCVIMRIHGHSMTVCDYELLKSTFMGSVLSFWLQNTFHNNKNIFKRRATDEPPVLNLWLKKAVVGWWMVSPTGNVCKCISFMKSLVAQSSDALISLENVMQLQAAGNPILTQGNNVSWWQSHLHWLAWESVSVLIDIHVCVLWLLFFFMWCVFIYVTHTHSALLSLEVKDIVFSQVRRQTVSAFCESRAEMRTRRGDGAEWPLDRVENKKSYLSDQ